MSYFDKKTLSILNRIRKSKDTGRTWGDLVREFGEDAANPRLLMDMDKENYIVTKDANGDWISFSSTPPLTIEPEFRSFSTPKGNELLEKRIFNFYKWIIPTAISVLALLISVIGLTQAQQQQPQESVPISLHCSTCQCDAAER